MLRSGDSIYKYLDKIARDRSREYYEALEKFYDVYWDGHRPNKHHPKRLTGKWMNSEKRLNAVLSEEARHVTVMECPRGDFKKENYLGI